MENINHTEISMDEFKGIESSIDSMMSEEILIETHKKLIGKSCKDAYREVKDCGVAFIKTFFSRDWSRTMIYQYSQGAERFIQSKYLSDYFKTSIRELISDENSNEEVLNALNSDKLINDMSQEEILAIHSAIKTFYAQARTEKVNVARHFMLLLYKLNGQGVASFIKNNVDSTDLASQILLTSGLNDRASYYSGRGVNRSDLNENTLVVIFSKLLKVDIEYAINFVDMVRQMKTLGATEFINSFLSFADKGFKTESLNMDYSNISLDGVYGETSYLLSNVSILATIGRGNNQDYQIRDSEQIKSSFMSRIRPTLQSINPDYDGLNNQSLNSGYYPKGR